MVLPHTAAVGRLVLWLAFALLCLALPARAQIALDATASASGTGSTLSWSHTVGSGSNRLLVVAVSADAGNQVRPVSSVTFGGLPLTLQVAQHQSISPMMEMWTLASPPGGTATVVVTYGIAPAAIVGESVSFSGVDQTTPVRWTTSGAAAGTGSTTIHDTQLASSVGDVVVDAVAARSPATMVATPAAGQTLRWHFSSGSMIFAGSTKPGEPVTTQMMWTITASLPFAGLSSGYSAMTLIPAPAADVAVTKNGPGTIIAGNNVTYTLGVTNSGPIDAQGVSLVDVVPAGTTFVSLTSTGGWACATPAVGATGTITCSIGSFAAAASDSFTLVVNVGAGVPNGTTITNTATVSSTTPDPAPGNNSASSSATVSNGADLAVTKSGPATINAGSNVTYTLGVTNSGPFSASSVALGDTLPAGTTFVSLAAAAGWTCTTPAVGGTGAVNCAIATLAAGASAAFTITVRVSAAAAGTTITNTATVSSTTADPTPANNAASAATTIPAANTSSGPSATGSGTVTVTFTGGGPGCTFSNAQFIGPPPGAPPIPPTLPPGPPPVFPHGLFTFSTIGCTPGSTITMTITYPSSIAGATYWKYGPTPTDPSAHWYVLPATIAGNTATFSITDGGLGDDDLAANGTIFDQGGPGIPPTTAANAIPTLSEWMLALLALTMMGIARRYLPGPRGRG